MDGDGQESIAASTAMLKAFSHPVRRAILRALDRLDAARAADLADALDIPANRLSFHLRTLADAGIITEDPSRARDRRDRVWVPAIRSITFGSAEDPIADEALGAVVVDGHIADHGDIVRRAAAWSMEYLTGRDAVMHGVMSRHAARLTPDEFRDLHQRIQALIDEARTNHDESAPSHMYEIDIVAADDAI